MSYKIFIFGLFAIGTSVLGVQVINLPGIPGVVRPCHRSDPQISECLKQNAYAMKPHMASGIPLLSIPSCEPLYIDEITFEKHEGIIAVGSIYRDVYVRGISNFTIDSINIDMDNNLMQAKIKIPQLLINAQYALEGKALMVPINGTGNCKGIFSDIDCDVVAQLEIYYKGLEKYLRCTEVAIDLNIAKGSINFENLFSKNGKIGKAMNKRLNENWKRVIDDLKPTIEAKIEENAKDFVNKIYGKYPMNLYLPE